MTSNPSSAILIVLFHDINVGVYQRNQVSLKALGFFLSALSAGVSFASTSSIPSPLLLCFIPPHLTTRIFFTIRRSIIMHSYLPSNEFRSLERRLNHAIFTLYLHVYFVVKCWTPDECVVLAKKAYDCVFILPILDRPLLAGISPSANNVKLMGVPSSSLTFGRWEYAFGTDAT